MLSRGLLRSRALLAAAPRASPVSACGGNGLANSLVFRRTLVAAPKAGDGPLLERRGDRELPDPESKRGTWLRTAPIFLVLLGASTLAIFNYQKSSSPVVASTLYALRVSPKAREYLGDEIYFADQMPWIWGEMNQLHGRIDITFNVKGTKNEGTMRFASHRPARMGTFVTTVWSLRTNDGEIINLLEEDDTFKAIEIDAADEERVVNRGLYSPTTA